MSRVYVRCLPLPFLLLIVATLAGCGFDSNRESGRVLYAGGIPDQDASRLVRRFDGVSQYMSKELGIEVKYIPSVDYAAVVIAFKRGDIHLAWFGGLTGLQARLAAPGSQAIIQRPRDAEFHSVFIVQANSTAESLQDLRGLTFSFGSESSTSGHLMPRYFLLEAGVNPDEDFKGLPNYSGSHDKTWKLVESGAFQAGALNEAVWARAVDQEKVDLSKVRVLETTSAYHDYNWSIRGDIDQEFGAGFMQKVKEAFLSMGEDQRELLDLFQTDRFIKTENANYEPIYKVAQRLEIVE